MAEPHESLLAPDSTTNLPEDPAYVELLELDHSEFFEIVKRHPDSLICWALLAEGSLNAGTLPADIAAYAYARTGYHRGLDLLRKSGWRGSGSIPWEHQPNQGFLRSLWALSRAAERLGESDEAQRCRQFLRDSSEAAYLALCPSDGGTEQSQPIEDNRAGDHQEGGEHN